MKVTVLLLTYNHAPFIACAINSVLMQDTSFDYELVVVDDFSTDGTREVLTDYQRQYPQKIRTVFHERNENNNRYITEMLDCSGEYAAWLDGDDCWISPHKLQKQVDFLDAHPQHSMCFHNVLCFSEEGVGQTFLHNETGARKMTFTIDDLFPRNFIGSCAPMFRRLPHFEMPEWYYSEWFGDWPLYMLYAEHGTIGYIDEIMGAYRRHRGALWSGLSEMQRTIRALEFLERMNERLDFRFDEEIQGSTARYKQHLEKLKERGHFSKQDPPQCRQPHVRAIYWPVGLLIGNGEDARPLLDHLEIKLGIDVDELVEVLFEAIPAVAMKTVELWNDIPISIRTGLEHFLIALEKKTPATGVADEVMARLEQRRLIASAALDLLARGRVGRGA